MSDPFSVAGSAVGVVSLGLTVCQGFLAYYEPWKAYDEEIHNFTSRVDNLQTLLQVLETLVSEAHDRSLSFERYHSLILGNLKACRQACQRLEEMLQRCKANPTSTEGVKKHDWLQLKRVRYPFKRNTLVSQSQAVTGFQNDLSMALQILHMATIQHQQKQLQELTSRSSSIDLRTTQILSTVESQGQLIIPSMRDKLQQESLIIQHSNRSILQPVSLKQLVERQVPVRRRLRSRTAGSSMCTCGSAPRGSRSTISFFALILHEKTCPLHQTGRKIISFGANYTLCNNVLGFSLQVMMTIEQKAGSLSMGPSLHMRRVVTDDSPAFELLQQVVRRKWEFPRANMAIYLEDTKRTLFQMFDNGQASPKDMLRDGSTLLHEFAAILNETLDAPSLVVARGFIKALIDAEVPLQERDARSNTPLDRFIEKWLVRDAWHIGDLELPEDLFRIYSDLLSSGSLLTSPTQALEELWWRSEVCLLDFSIMRHLIVRNMDEVSEYILPDVELAVHIRSEEGLLEYIACPHHSNLDIVILMCVGWPQGLSMILNSPLRLHVKSMLDPFMQACKARDAECALLLLEATEVITGDHLEFAAFSDHPDILDVVVSRIACQRRELQNLALRQLSSHQIRQLGLPTEDLLDVHAFKVQEALKDQPVAMKLESMAVFSVYGHTLNSRNAANRLFEAGFKNLNQTNEHGHTPLLLLRHTKPHSRHKFMDSLHFAQWMVSHGASLDQKTQAGYPAIYYLAEGIGEDMSLQYFLKFRAMYTWPSPLNDMWRLEQTCVGLLHTILLDDTQDSCSCACSLGGCRPLTRMLRHFYSSSIVEEAEPWILDVFRCFQAVLIRGSLCDSIPTLAERVLRYVTFERIGIKHTCHYKDERLDEDEVEEIQDEERHNLALLEDLMEEFNRKCQVLGIRTDKFLNGYWMDSMGQAISADREINSKAIQRIQELGVVLSGPA